MGVFKLRNLINFLVIVIVIYAALIIAGDYSKIAMQLESLNISIVAIIILFAFTDDLIRFFKWDYFLRKLGIKVPIKSSFLIFFSGLSMSMTPAKAGEVMKSYLLKKTHGVEMKKSVMVVFMERLTDAFGLLILALLGSFAFFESTYYQFFIVVVLLLAVSGFAMLTNRRVFLKISKLLSRIHVFKRYIKHIEEIYDNSRKLLSFRTIILATTVSVISWFFECMAFYFLLNSLGVQFSIQAAGFVFAFSSIFGNIVPLPGGLGATEGSFVGLLLLNGVPLSTATFSTILIRIFTLFFGISIGIIALTYVSRMKGALIKPSLKEDY